jgi:hypothetical protein
VDRLADLARLELQGCPDERGVQPGRRHDPEVAPVRRRPWVDRVLLSQPPEVLRSHLLLDPKGLGPGLDQDVLGVDLGELQPSFLIELAELRVVHARRRDRRLDLVEQEDPADDIAEIPLGEVLGSELLIERVAQRGPEVGQRTRHLRGVHGDVVIARVPLHQVFLNQGGQGEPGTRGLGRLALDGLPARGLVDRGQEPKRRDVLSQLVVGDAVGADGGGGRCGCAACREHDAQRDRDERETQEGTGDHPPILATPPPSPA